MNRTKLFLPILALSLFVFAGISEANIELEDLQANILFSSAAPFDSGTVDTGSGNVSDYEIIACAVVDPNNVNSFSPPLPGNWTEIDTGPCEGDFNCIGGVWGRFTTNSNSEEVDCSWSEDNFVFAGGAMRLSGVDADPIIAVSCDTGTGTNTAKAPSVITEANSYVVRTYTFVPITTNTLSEPLTYTSFEEMRFEGISFNTFQFIATDGVGEFAENAGPTGEGELLYTPADIAWRACTIALRMGTPPPLPTNPIPTMNEWGFMAVAAFMGIAGVWYLRRRQQTA